MEMTGQRFGFRMFGSASAWLLLLAAEGWPAVVVALVFAGLVIAHPGIAPGLHSTHTTVMKGTM